MIIRMVKKSRAIIVMQEKEIPIRHPNRIMTQRIMYPVICLMQRLVTTSLWNAEDNTRHGLQAIPYEVCREIRHHLEVQHPLPDTALGRECSVPGLPIQTPA